MLKRYQYWSKDGIKWTDWFECFHSENIWQIKNNLKNEYK